MILSTHMVGFSGDRPSFLLLKTANASFPAEVVTTARGLNLSSRASITQENRSGGRTLGASSLDKMIVPSGSPLPSGYLECTDGSLFDLISHPFMSITSVCYRDPYWVAADTARKSIWYSVDNGTTWTENNFGGAIQVMGSVHAGDSFFLFFETSTSGTLSYWYTADPSGTWTKVTIGTGYPVPRDNSYYANGVFVLAAREREVKVVSGSNMTAFSTGETTITPNGQGGITYSPELDFWIRSHGDRLVHQISTATDPSSTWSTYESDLNPESGDGLCAVFWTGFRFLLVDSNGGAWSSETGLDGSWVECNKSGGATSGAFSVGIRNIFA